MRNGQDDSKFQMPKYVKAHGKAITIQSILAFFAVLGALWGFSKPILVPLVSDALAEDVKEIVRDETAPLSSAFIALLRGNISNISRDIAMLEFDQQSGNWTAEKAQRLSQLRISLMNTTSAVEALEESRDKRGRYP